MASSPISASSDSLPVPAVVKTEANHSPLASISRGFFPFIFGGPLCLLFVPPLCLLFVPPDTASSTKDHLIPPPSDEELRERSKDPRCFECGSITGSRVFISGYRGGNVEGSYVVDPQKPIPPRVAYARLFYTHPRLVAKNPHLYGRWGRCSSIPTPCPCISSGTSSRCPANPHSPFFDRLA